MDASPGLGAAATAIAMTRKGRQCGPRIVRKSARRRNRSQRQDRVGGYNPPLFWPRRFGEDSVIRANPTPPTPRAGERLRLGVLHGSGDALALAGYAADPRTYLVLTATAEDARRLAAETAWLAPGRRVRLLPDWETLPYDAFSPHQDLVSERLATLYALTQGQCDLIIAPVSTAVVRLAPPHYLAAHAFAIRKGDRLDLNRLRQQCATAGYHAVSQVMSPGEFCVRGGLIDLFPSGSVIPYRIDLFDDEVEQIRCFDVDTQRSLYPVGEINLLPAREFPLDEAGRSGFRRRFREHFVNDPTKTTIYRDVSNGIATAGIEYYLPLFFDQTATLFDYLPDDAAVCLHRDVPGALSTFWKETRSRFELLRHDRDRPLIEPTVVFLDEEQLYRQIQDRARVSLAAAGDAAADQATPGLTSALPALAIDRRAEDPAHRLRAFRDQFPGTILVVAESPGRRESIAELLRDQALTVADADAANLELRPSGHNLTVAPLQGGFIWGDLAVVCEADLFPGTTSQRGRNTRRRLTSENWLRDLTELRIGDPVVHEAHGIGRYRGLLHLDLGEGDMEFIELHYAGEAKLYVPVSQLAVLSRYTGADPDTAPLHALGSPQWEKAKRKAALQARDVAAELLALYAARNARQGHAFEFSLNDYEAFAEGFGFEETPDQQAAIAAVLSDMRAGKPMDRLVCGDVGFGKTEVALRAAFAAVAGGHQVAVLCPTTLLCEQHYRTFCDRFAGWPVNIAELSRFRSARESAAALAGLAEGKLDIVIGTHKLIQSDVRFAKLGLVIIDEEHRFGVRQKESLRKLRAEVDVLTLTATPIPRTLAMSLEGIRDFSVIATAPQKRLAIKTFVTRFADGTIREAILRELKRGGQVYFLHNEVATIEAMRDRLARTVPEARILVGHGQMGGVELERVMREFTHGRANVLLCTTIVETGIDIPNANTILIDRADKFGLAQLHQLRGRVGRSHHQAYAYLLIDDEQAINKQARQRLEAIQMMEELGSGFYLAMHDLEIRGAGEVLGESQSGEMEAVGFALYSEMLDRAVAALRAGNEPDLALPSAIATEINLHEPALLPDRYCADVHERLNLYKRLAHCADADELRAVQEELIDRFGELPPQARCLIESHRIRIRSGTFGIVKLDAGIDRLLVQFAPKPPLDPMKIIRLVQTRREYQLAGQDKLLLKCHCPTLQEKLAVAGSLFDYLAA
jgi:transcription-repair coupling factor (superfamily II helicase)